MGRGLTLATWLCAALALSCAGFASAAGGISIGLPLEFEMEAGIKPKALSRTTPEPIQVKLKSEVGTSNGLHPPALTELILEADKNLTVDATGIPTCNGGLRQQRGIEATDAACREAIIGAGEITVETAYPENKPVVVSSELLLINGGVSGGTTTWHLYGYFDSGLAFGGDLVIPVEIRKRSEGRYGTVVAARIPKIGEGYVSVLSLQVAIAKNVKGEDGKTYHPITGRCADGRLRFGVRANFADGQFAPVELERPCTPKT